MLCSFCKNNPITFRMTHVILIIRLLIYRVECEELFCKSNIKLKVLKLNKNTYKFYIISILIYSVYLYLFTL